MTTASRPGKVLATIAGITTAAAALCTTPATGATPAGQGSVASRRTACSGPLIATTFPSDPASAFAIGTNAKGQDCLIRATSDGWKPVPIPSSFQPMVMTGNIVYNGQKAALVHVGSQWRHAFVPGVKGGGVNFGGFDYTWAAGAVVVGQGFTTSPSSEFTVEAQFNPKTGKFLGDRIPAIVDLPEVFGMAQGWVVGQLGNSLAGGARWDQATHKWVQFSIPHTANDVLVAAGGGWLAGEASTTGLLYRWDSGHPRRYAVPAGIRDVTQVDNGWAIGSNQRETAYHLLHFTGTTWTVVPSPTLNQFTELNGQNLIGFRPAKSRGTVWNATLSGGRVRVTATMNVAKWPANIGG